MFKNLFTGCFHSLSLKTAPLILAFSALLGGCLEDEKNIPPPEIFLTGEGEEIEFNLGDTIRLEPKITYNFDATYQWKKNGEVVNTNEQFLLDSATQLGSIEYLFTVTTPNGSDSMTIPVDIIVLADFQNLQLAEETDTFWIGELNIDGFSHKDVFFPNQYQDTEIWQGFGFSNIQSNSSNPESIPPYSVYNGSKSENIYGLVNQPNEISEFTPTIQFNDDKNHNIKSLEINNTNLAFYLLEFGSDEFPRMGGATSSEPDWCKVTITGLNTSGEITGEIDFFLADFRFENNKRDYIIKKWTEIDLHGLNAVNKIQFSITSTLENEQGEMVTPEIFCIDNIKILN